MVMQAGEEETEVLLVLVLVAAGHQDVVQVHKGKVQSSADVVHQALEGLSGVAQTKRHAEELKEVERSDDGSLGDILWSHRDLVVAANQVDLGENVRASQVG